MSNHTCYECNQQLEGTQIKRLTFFDLDTNEKLQEWRCQSCDSLLLELRTDEEFQTTLNNPVLVAG